MIIELTSAFDVKVDEPAYSADGELFIVTRIQRTERDGIQFYGYPCTGPLNNSTNCLGELNEFQFVPAHESEF